MIYLALWIVPALVVCITLSFIFGTIVGALVSTFEKLWIRVKNSDSPAMARVWGGGGLRRFPTPWFGRELEQAVRPRA